MSLALPKIATSIATAERVFKVQLIPPPSNPPADGLLGLLERAAGSTLAQSIIVVVATALITGFAVPVIKARMDMRFFSEQKAHEARLARQAEIIKEQTEFLRKFVEVVWHLHFAMIQVSYAKVTCAPESKFATLWDGYDEKSWACLNDLRRTISSGIHLLSVQRFEHLLKFYAELLAEDETLSVEVRRKDMKHQDWVRSHMHLLDEVSATIDVQIAALAEDLQLRFIPSQVPGPQSQ